MIKKTIFFMLLALILSVPCLAAMPRTLNYQGKLLNVTTKVPITSPMLVNFLIYDDPNTGSPLWQEEQLVSPDANGIISVVLGNTTPINADFSQQLWLAVQAPTGIPNALWPRRQLTAAPYALYAVTAESVVPGGPGTDPVGAVIAFAGSTAPNGWLLCDGSTYNAVANPKYLDLYNIITTTYGGSGSTNFNVPDMRSRVPVGKSTDPNFNALGRITGEVMHTLSVREMPSHDHGTPIGGGSSGSQAFPGSPVSNWAITTPSGESQPHFNVQPSLVINYIIKY